MVIKRNYSYIAHFKSYKENELFSNHIDFINQHHGLDVEYKNQFKENKEENYVKVKYLKGKR
jgi:hypothetical protein